MVQRKPNDIKKEVIDCESVMTSITNLTFSRKTKATPKDSFCGRTILDFCYGPTVPVIVAEAGPFVPLTLIVTTTGIATGVPPAVPSAMRKVNIVDPGDTKFLEDDLEDKFEFVEENDWVFDKKIITESGDSTKLRVGQVVSLREVREENSILRRNDKKLIEFRDARPATSSPTLLGITKASLGVKSWISAASFQETTKVLSSAAIHGKTDEMIGLKENVITGHPIPAGTGLREFENMIIGSKEEYELLQTTREAMAFDEEE